MFTDRDVIYKQDAPGGAWNLYIFGPAKSDPTMRSPIDPPFYASFQKKAKGTITCLPFGRTADAAEVAVKWDRAEGVCEVFIGDDCYVLFWYGTWKARTRGHNRLEPQSPFSPEQIKTMEEKGWLPDEPISEDPACPL